MKMNSETKMVVTVSHTGGWRLFIGRILCKLFDLLDIKVSYKLK